MRQKKAAETWDAITPSDFKSSTLECELLFEARFHKTCCCLANSTQKWTIILTLRWAMRCWWSTVNTKTLHARYAANRIRAWPTSYLASGKQRKIKDANAVFLSSWPLNFSSLWGSSFCSYGVECTCLFYPWHRIWSHRNMGTPVVRKTINTIRILDTFLLIFHIWIARWKLAQKRARQRDMRQQRRDQPCGASSKHEGNGRQLDYTVYHSNSSEEQQSDQTRKCAIQATMFSRPSSSPSCSGCEI